jgi:hypothetical protein
MAFAVSSSGATYVVARYSPPGNTLGESPQQDAVGGRGGKSLGNAFPPRDQLATASPFGSAQQSYGRYGQQRLRQPQSRYDERRSPYGKNVARNNNEAILGARDRKPRCSTHQDIGFHTRPAADPICPKAIRLCRSQARAGLHTGHHAYMDRGHIAVARLGRMHRPYH